MILRKEKAFKAFTSAGETVLINTFKRLRHEYDAELGFYEVESGQGFLMDDSGRPVNCLENGNYQILDDENLIDAVCSDPAVC